MRSPKPAAVKRETGLEAKHIHDKELCFKMMAGATRCPVTVAETVRSTEIAREI